MSDLKPVGAWKVTEAEYRKALEISRDVNSSEEQSADAWQLCRYYRSVMFNAIEAARALRAIRPKV